MGQERAPAGLPGASAGPKVAIHILRGKAASKSREMRGPTLLIGSGPHCDIQMRSSEVAAKHCLINREPGRVTIRRLDGSYPLFVNDAECDESLLGDGDVVRVGPFELRIESDVDSAPKAAIAAAAAPAWESGVGADGTPAPAASFSASDHASLDLALRDLARRERELLDRSEELDRRFAALQAKEDSLAQRRLAAADEALDADRQREKNERLRAKLLRASRLIAQRRRDRLASADSAVQEAQHRIGALELREQEVDRREDELRRWEEELHRLQSQIEPVQSDLSARVDELERAAAELEGRKRSLELDLENLNVRERGVERLREDVDARRRRLLEDEAHFQSRCDSVEAEAAQLASQKEQIAAALQSLELREQTLVGQEEHLRRTAQELEQSRQELLAREEAAEARWSVVEEALRQAEENAALRENLTRQAEELQQQQQRLESQLLKLEVREQGAVDAERRAAEWNRELTRREQLLEERLAEAAPTNASRREAQVESAHREELLAMRESELDRRQAEQAGLEAALTKRARLLQEEQQELQHRRESVEDLWMQTQVRAGDLAGDSARLESLAAELKSRQTTLSEREKEWCENLQRRRRDVEALAADVREKRRLLDRQSAVHRRRLDRLREVGVKVLSRRKESSAQLERLEQRHEAYRRRLERLQADQRDLLEAVVQFAEHAAQRESQAVSRIEVVRAENQHLARLQDSVREHAEAILATFQALPPYAASTSAPSAEGVDGHSLAAEQRRVMVEEIERALAEWSSLLDSLRNALAEREREMNARESDFKTGKELLERLLSRAAQCATTGPSNAEVLVPNLQQEAARTPAAPTTDDSLLHDRILAEGLLAADTLAGAEAEAKSLGIELGNHLESTRLLTGHQIACLREDRFADLRLGPLDVLDVLHRGAMGTIYRVRSPHSRESWALRLMDERWRVDAGMKSTMETAIQQARALRRRGIAAVCEFVEWSGRLGIVEEYVEGVSLQELDVFQTTLDDQISWFQQSLEALAAAEQVGVLHLALRPSRILTSADGNATLVGFGEPEWLRKIHRCERGRAHAAFLAPEAMSVSDSIDNRADLYSLGCIFQDLRRRVSSDGANSEAYDRILAKLTQARPEDRFAAAGDALEALACSFRLPGAERRAA